MVRLSNEQEKRDMVQRLAEHGGREVTYPLQGAIIIQDHFTLRVKLENQRHNCNVVKVEGGESVYRWAFCFSSLIFQLQPAWVTACEKAGRRVDFERSLMLWANEETKKLMDENTDIFGALWKNPFLSFSHYHPLFTKGTLMRLNARWIPLMISISAYSHHHNPTKLCLPMKL